MLTCPAITEIQLHLDHNQSNFLSILASN